MKSIIIILSVLISVSLQAGWVKQSSPVTTDLYSVTSHHGSDNSTWICGAGGVILYTSNGGANWTVQNSGTTADLHAIVFMEIAGNPVFACGENGTMLYTTNNGSDWISINMNTSNTLRDISDFNFIAVGDSGVIFRSTNSGLNWQSVPSPVTADLYAVSGTFGYYAVGRAGTIIKGINPGQLWTELNSGITNDLFGVPLFGRVDIAVGDNGLILGSSNFGTSWYSQNSFTNSSLKSIEYSANNTSRIICAGDNGVVLKSTDYGTTWGSQISGTSEDLNSIFFYLGDSRGFACGDNGTILRTTDGGGVFTDITNSSTEKITDFTLSQNFPNPFNPKTIIKYHIPVSGFVSLKIYDALGNEVTALVNEKQSSGSYDAAFDGNGLSSGIYYYSLYSDGILKDTKRMLLLK